MLSTIGTALMSFNLTLHLSCFLLRFVWTSLVFELILECIIRPHNYWELVRTERAFNPTTARYMNFFHIFFETASLMLFLPQLPCAFGGLCGSDARLTILWAANTAMTSVSQREAALGRFFLGLTFLRAFGLFRHWKKMWMSFTYKKDKDETCM
jgi:hypothetical protein